MNECHFEAKAVTYSISSVDIAKAAGEEDKHEAAIFSSKHCFATPCALALAGALTNIAVRSGSPLGANMVSCRVRIIFWFKKKSGKMLETSGMLSI